MDVDDSAFINISTNLTCIPNFYKNHFIFVLCYFNFTDNTDMSVYIVIVHDTLRFLLSFSNRGAFPLSVYFLQRILFISQRSPFLNMRIFSASKINQNDRDSRRATRMQITRQFVIIIYVLCDINVNRDNKS